MKIDGDVSGILQHSVRHVWIGQNWAIVEASANTEHHFRFGENLKEKWQDNKNQLLSFYETGDESVRGHHFLIFI